MPGCGSLLWANTCSLWSGIKSWPGAGCLQRLARRRWQWPTTSLPYVYYRRHGALHYIGWKGISNPFGFFVIDGLLSLQQLRSYNGFRVEITKVISSVPLFSWLLALWIHTLVIECHFHTWQVPPQPSCGATYHIWIPPKYSKGYFCRIKNVAYREI